MEAQPGDITHQHEAHPGVTYQETDANAAATAQHLWISEHAAAYEAAAAAAEAVHRAQSDAFGSEEMHGSENHDDYNDAADPDLLKRTTKKKSKGGRIASEITREELAECFNMPSEDAAKKLGVGLTVLKRICRKFGVPRWPFRKLKSLDRLITNVESGTPPGDTYKHLMKSAEEIREHQKAMCTGVVLELDDKTKKLQQAYSKFNHKQRKAAKDDDPSGMHMLDGVKFSEDGQSQSRSHDEEQHGATMGVSSAHMGQVANEQQQAAQDQMMYMLPGMPFPMPVMMVDPAYQQQMMAAVPVAMQPQQQAVAEKGTTLWQEQPVPAEKDEQTAEAAPRPPEDPSAAAASTAAASHMAASATAWGGYAAPHPGAAEAAAAYWNGWAAPQPAAADDPNAAAAAASAAQAAAAASYYANPMAYMQMAAAGQQDYAAYSAYMPGYMAGYDPAAMQQYMQQYQAWRPHLMGTPGGTAGAADAGGMPGMYQMPGTEQAAGTMDPSHAAVAQQQAAAAQAAYYAQFSHPWAMQMAQMPLAAAGMGGMGAAANGGQYGVPAAPPEAGSSVPRPEQEQQQQQQGQQQEQQQGHARQEEAPAAQRPKEEEGKRKRKPNMKYEDYAQGDELDSTFDGHRHGHDPHNQRSSRNKEQDASVAHTLMHMASHGAAAPADQHGASHAAAPSNHSQRAGSSSAMQPAMMSPHGAMVMQMPPAAQMAMAQQHMMQAAAAGWAAYPGSVVGGMGHPDMGQGDKTLAAGYYPGMALAHPYGAYAQPPG